MGLPPDEWPCWWERERAPGPVADRSGRKTGKPRSTPVAYFEHDDGYLVTASAGGAPANPQWIRNLEAARQARIQIGEHQYDVDVRLAAGDERWQNVVLTQAPFFADYEKKSGRSIPLALLIPRM